MRILEVIPIARGITIETLSYFTASEASIGSIVKVPLRKKNIPAIVVSSREVVEIKSEIKNAAFTLKKINNLKSTKLFDEEFVETAKDTADYFASSFGSVLYSIVPKMLFEKADKLKLPKKTPGFYANPAEKFVLQSNDEDRYAHYKSIIREHFAKNSSVFFCLPTVQDIKHAEEYLKKGIEPYTFVLHSYVDKKELFARIQKIVSEKHPVLVIATAGFLSLPKNDFGAIILEKENSRAYKLHARPYLDLRVFAEIYAKKIRAKLIFGDLMLRAETIHRHDSGELHEISLKYRSLTTSSQEIIDMKKNDTVEGEKKKFKVFSPELEEKIKENFKHNQHLFIFVARRGLSPSTVCADCGNIVKCNFCDAHTVLHRGAENFFLCHKCGERRSAKETCANCGSWKLSTLGIGAELVEEEVKKLLPEGKIFRIDSDKTPDHKRALAVAEKFYAEPHAVLIGTEMALLYLTKKVENSAVVSMDAFFSIPDFRINERIMNILLKMRAATDRSFIIQTRDIKQKVFEYAVSGNLVDFYRDEIEDRKKFHYPPFSTIVKISITGSREECVKNAEELQKLVAPQELDIFPAFVPQGKSKVVLNAVMKVPEKKWPNAGLSDKFKSLPPNFAVNVDPESLI
jgi:primosomal protein N' (replication factor Y)